MAFADAAILLIGDEILQGRVFDVNIPAVARELSWRGLPVTRAAVAADEAGSIAEALASIRRRNRIVVTTGGLGPTEDDLTPSAVAAALGLGMRSNPDALGMIENRYLARGATCPPSALRQAMLPEGAAPVENPAGIAPGIVLPLRETSECIVMLPGVPAEVEALAGPCLDAAGAAGPGLGEVRCLRIWGIPENRLMDIIKAEGLDRGAALAFLPRPGQVELSLKGDRAGEGFEAVKERLAGSVFSERRDLSIEQALGSALAEAGLSLATAESCTGGLLGARITSIPGSSAWFLGGVVSYSNGAKSDLLGVSRTTIDAFGAVSAETAREMASGASRLLGARAVLSVTGIAGPDGGTPSKPVGTVWICSRLDGRTEVREFGFGGTRTVIREAACTCAMGMLLVMLREARA